MDAQASAAHANLVVVAILAVVVDPLICGFAAGEPAADPHPISVRTIMPDGDTEHFDPRGLGVEPD